MRPLGNCETGQRGREEIGQLTGKLEVVRTDGPFTYDLPLEATFSEVYSANRTCMVAQGVTGCVVSPVVNRRSPIDIPLLRKEYCLRNTYPSTSSPVHKEVPLTGLNFPTIR
jgi:hypothetical protein